MIDFFAQSTSPDITAIAIQGGGVGILLLMLRWFMTQHHASMKETNVSLKSLADSHDRMGRQIAASNDRMGRANLMLALALDGVNEAAKARARALVEEFDESLKQQDKEQKDREGGR